jgi:hypothetical protein
MSSKKLKSESPSKCYFNHNFAACLLRLISSFLGAKERALRFERVCTEFKKASRHPSSFAGARLNLNPLLGLHPRDLAAWLARYSNPPLSAVCFQPRSYIPEHQRIPIALAAFGTHLQTLQIASDGIHFFSSLFMQRFFFRQECR